MVAVFRLHSCFQGRGKPVTWLMYVRIYSDVIDERLLVHCHSPERGSEPCRQSQEPPGTKWS